MFESIDTQSITLTQAGMVIAFALCCFAFAVLCISFLVMVILRLKENPPDWQNLAEKLNIRPWSAREAEAMLMAIISLMLAGREVIRAFYCMGLIPEARTDSYLVAAQALMFDLPIIILVFALLIRNKSIGKGIFGYTPAQIRSAVSQGIMFCMAILPVIGIVALIQNALLTHWGFTNEKQYVIQLFERPGSLWLKIDLVLMSVIAAPITEEFIFRGIGISALTDKTGMKWAVLIMSLAFATIHFNLFAFLPLFVIAVGFSMAYIYTGTLLVPIVMHSVFNALNIAVLLMSKQVT